MLRSMFVSVASLLAAVTAYAEPARAPVKVYLISPEDQPDKSTVLSATKQSTHDVKHLATTWGGELVLYLNAAPDCQATDLTTTVVAPPSHGRLTFTDGLAPPFKYVLAAFSKGDPRGACQTLPARHAFYLPDPDFTGRDHVVIVFRDGGSTFSDNIDIVVRRAEHPNPLRADRH
jgi:hypothetical protein